MGLNFQPSTKDTYISSGNPTINYGSEESLIIYNTANTDRALLTFDVSLLTGTIVDAKLYLYYFNNAVLDPVGLTVNVYKVRRTDWVEAEATWNIFKNANNWSTAGASNTTTDIDTTLAGSFVMPASYGWVECDITDIVQDAITNNSGIVDLRVSFASEGAGAQLAVFHSSEYTGGDDLKPKIVINPTPVNVSVTGATLTWSGATLILRQIFSVTGAICNVLGATFNLIKRSAWKNSSKNNSTFTNQDKNG